MMTKGVGPEKVAEQVDHVATLPTSYALHNSRTTLEEYIYYAEASRAMEVRNDSASPPPPGFFSNFIGRGAKNAVPSIVTAPTSTGEHDHKGSTDVQAGSTNLISDEEWNTASRAGRTATWTAVFYLITTDMMGPYSVPYVY